MDIQISTSKYKKYMVKTPKGKIIHFGDKRYEHFKDTTGLGKYSNLNHNDKKRRENYCKRAKGIKDGKGNLTYNNKESPNYYSMKYLWSC
tara:strand:+ start:747 stop:1016 length:270 start_codon:yes stop_codon:yes gene_type:complete